MTLFNVTFNEDGQPDAQAFSCATDVRESASLYLSKERSGRNEAGSMYFPDHAGRNNQAGHHRRREASNVRQVVSVCLEILVFDYVWVADRWCCDLVPKCCLISSDGIETFTLVLPRICAPDPACSRVCEVINSFYDRLFKLYIVTVKRICGFMRPRYGTNEKSSLIAQLCGRASNL